MISRTICTLASWADQQQLFVVQTHKVPRRRRQNQLPSSVVRLKFFTAMTAFIQTPLIASKTIVRHAKRTSRQRWTCQQSTDDIVRPRFTRGDEDAGPATSFFEEPKTPKTPNERALQQVRETMTRLGADAEAPQPRPFKPIDISRINPVSALFGSVAAGGISYGTWLALGGIVAFFVSHPLDDQIYVVQRLGAVARTILVCLFALGSGMSGVTSVGLGALFVRTLYGKVSGEFRE